MTEINGSGFQAFDRGVIVRIEPHKDKQTKGGIILAQNERATNIESMQIGTLAYAGKTAFDGYEEKPQVGDEVFFIKYAGHFIYSYDSLDEQNYRIMTDHDIVAVKMERTHVDK